MPIAELLRHLALYLANGFLALSYALWEHLAGVDATAWVQAIGGCRPGGGLQAAPILKLLVGHDVRLILPAFGCMMNQTGVVDGFRIASSCQIVAL